MSKSCLDLFHTTHDNYIKIRYFFIFFFVQQGCVSRSSVLDRKGQTTPIREPDERHHGLVPPDRKQQIHRVLVHLSNMCYRVYSNISNLLFEAII